MNLIDPLHEKLHRVRYTDNEEYEDGSRTHVKAICGKEWQPYRPNKEDRKKTPRCSACFPPNHETFVVVI